MNAIQRNHYIFSWRDDLVSLALEFRLGHWDSGWNGPFDDRYDAADNRANRAEAHQECGEWTKCAPQQSS